MAVTIRPIMVADYPALVDLMKADTNPPTVASLEHQDQGRPAGLLLYRAGAFVPDGRMIGYGRASAEPARRPGCFDLLVRVDPAWRRQGIGTALYRDLEQYAVDHGATVLDGYTGDEPCVGQLWAEALGFRLHQHLFESRLELASFDAAPYQAAVVRLESEGIRLTTFAEYAQDEAALERLRAFYAELTRDVPGSDGMAEPTLDEFKQQTVLAPGWEPQEVHLAVHGDRWIGMSRVHRLPDGSFVNDLTAVHRDYRGRGVATAVKVKALEYARSKGGTWIRTHNDASNGSMLSVNRKLGYRPEPGIYRFSRTVS